MKVAGGGAFGETNADAESAFCSAVLRAMVEMILGWPPDSEAESPGARAWDTDDIGVGKWWGNQVIFLVVGILLQGDANSGFSGGNWGP